MDSSLGANTQTPRQIESCFLNMLSYLRRAILIRQSGLFKAKPLRGRYASPEQAGLTYQGPTSKNANECSLLPWRIERAAPKSWAWRGVRYRS